MLSSVYLVEYTLHQYLMIEIYTRNFDLHITVPSPNLAFLCRNLDYKPYSIIIYCCRTFVALPHILIITTSMTSDNILRLPMTRLREYFTQCTKDQFLLLIRDTPQADLDRSTQSNIFQFSGYFKYFIINNYYHVCRIRNCCAYR